MQKFKTTSRARLSTARAESKNDDKIKAFLTKVIRYWSERAAKERGNTKTVLKEYDKKV